MAANTAKCFCRIRGLSLEESLDIFDERDWTKPTKASRTRSVSPPRTRMYDWEEFSRINEVDEDENSVAAAKKPWRRSLKEFLYRSTSEGRARAREKEMERERLVQAAVRTEKKKKQQPSSTKVDDCNFKKLGDRSAAISKKLSSVVVLKETSSPPRSPNAQIASKVLRRGAVSAHERYYSANRAEAEQLKKKTFLPYRQGLLGFLGPFQSSNSGTPHAISYVS